MGDVFKSRHYLLQDSLELSRSGSISFTATMPKPVAKPTSDSDFYLPADRFFSANLPNALTYDDVSLATLHSEILPRDTDLATSLSESLRLQIPILSSDMDTVTESRMAIAMALNGGLGLIHYNLPAKDQIKEIARVKHHIHGLIQDPMTVLPDATIGDVLQMIEQRRFDFRTFPVADEAGKLVGLLSGNVVKDRYPLQARLGGHDAPQTAPDDGGKTHRRRPDQGRGQVFHRDRHPQDPRRRRLGPPARLITSSDVERITGEAKSRRKPARDEKFRLVVGAAISPIRKPGGELDRTKILDHVGELVRESVDAVAISTAHGHTSGVGDMVKLIRSTFKNLTIIAGNVTSGEGVEFLADCGANAIKIGQGPGSICTTRIVAGVGIPQLTALHVAGQGAKRKGVRLIADGGITKSGDIVKALTLSDAVILGGLLAGCREAPGEIYGRNLGQALQTVPRHGFPRRDEGRLRRPLRPRQERHGPQGRRRGHRGAQGSLGFRGRCAQRPHRRRAKRPWVTSGPATWANCAARRATSASRPPARRKRRRMT